MRTFLAKLLFLGQRTFDHAKTSFGAGSAAADRSPMILAICHHGELGENVGTGSET